MPLERLLPGGSFGRGTLVEWLATGVGSGAWGLALRGARQACLEGRSLVVIDASGEFHPPATAGMGIDPASLILMRPSSERDLLWAWDQSLRCPAIGAVVGRFEWLDSRSFRRLQLSAEMGGALGMLVRPAAMRGDPSWAEARFLVEPRPSVAGVHGAGRSARRLRVELLRARGTSGAGMAELEIDDETGAVRMVSELADPAALRRPAGA